MKVRKEISPEKEAIRLSVRSQLKKEPKNIRLSKSIRIKDLTLNNLFFKKVKVVMFYYSTSLEVDTRELIREALKAGKTVILPAVDPKKNEIVPVAIQDTESLVEGAFGILEPALDPKNIFPVAKIELVFVPGVAFDKWGNRLGRGLGFYDRFLSKLNSKTLKVGLAFNFQLVDSVPTVQGQDVPLDLVISN